jgi:NitT/TauT family transport system permease protein
MSTSLESQSTSRNRVPGSAGGKATSERRLAAAGRVVFWQAVLPVVGVVVTIAAWWALTHVFQIPTLFLPSPPDIVNAMVNNWQLLMEESWVTVLETLAGFALGGSAGLIGAAVLASSPTLERATLPLVVALNAIPKVALAPLLIVWLGLGSAPKVALAALICFFPIMIAAMAGLTATPSELGELARSLSASRWQMFAKVRVPWALPQVFVGLKLGMTLAVIGTVVAQLARPSGGLGAVILVSGQSVNTSLAFAAITLLMVISITLFYTVVLAERLLLPWARETTAARI